MEKKSKRQAALELLKANDGALKCPKCGEALILKAEALACKRGHSFDVARKGYVNLFPQGKAVYDGGLFSNRRETWAMGFFSGLSRELKDILNGIRGTVLDAGCGEGSMLAEVCGENLGVGADISKDGIELATDYPHCIWLVTDLAALPLADNSCAAVINVLSPANYSEFARVLKPGGLLVKAIPGESYMAEVRQFLYGEADYRSKPVSEHFKRHARLLGERRVTYKFIPKPEELEKIVNMSPLSWGAALERQKELVKQEPAEITADFRILYGVTK